ncbi:MAG: RNA polymerase sigma factor [Kiritimatiellae bacterium]|nr:RNA polymerase sigma factor [Kiritimatiellia bacterium]
MTIVEEIRNDPQQGAKRLDSEYRAGLTTLARRICHDDGDAAELVNHTFAEVIANIDRYAEQSAFFGWMSKILVNLHAKEKRRRSNQMLVFPGEVPECVDEDATERIYREVDASLLRDAVSELPQEMRDAVVLRYFMDLPLARVAKILSVPEGTVNSRLHYARLALAAKLGATAKKPGGKAILLALLLCGLTALGAAITAALPDSGTSPASSRVSSSAEPPSSNLPQSPSGVAGSPQRGAEGGATFSQGEPMNKTQTTRAAAMLAAATVATSAALPANSSAGIRPVADTYAMSGLIARWDAIDNVGTGTHDSSATTWKDLAGDNDMTIDANSGAGWKNGNAFYLNSLANGVCPAYGKSGNTNYKTIEIVYKKATSKGRLLWCGGEWSRYVAFDYTDTAAPWQNAKVYFDGAKATQHTVVSDCEPTSLVALYNDSNAVVDIYRDGEENNAGAKNANTWSVDGNSTMVRLGSRSKTNTSQNTTQGWEGEVYAIRLYDRQLTPQEIARNYSLDAARFFGAGFTTNVVVATAVEGLEGSEPSGMYMIDAEGHEFSAPVTATKDGTIYDCTGYTLETWNGSGWGEPVLHDGETSCTLTDTSALVRLTWQWAPAEIVAQDYTWMASPANANWDGTSANWNSGEAWADGNNAVFGSSSQTTVTVGSERLVNDLTINNVAYTFNGSGPLRVAGTITPGGAKDQHFNVPLASGRADGSLHLYATGVDWRSAYLDSVNNLQTSTVVDGTVFLMAKGDGSFGPVPAAPTENIVINSGNPLVYGNGTISIHSNRTVKIKSGAALWTGSNSPFTYKPIIVAEPDEGSDWSLDTYVKIRSNWGGLITFDPGANRTNAFGRLFVDTRRLKLASGVTAVTGPATSTGESAITYVKGNGSAFSTDRGYLLIEGGELYSPKMTGDRYVDVGAYGQVIVTNGGKVTMPEGIQWINGLTTPGKLTVTKGGSLAVEQLRVSQSGADQSEVHLDEGGRIAVYQLRMDNASAGLFAFNGGCLQALRETRAFYAGASASWANVSFTVGEKGAGFDLSNGVNLWWGKTLTSGAAMDGGLFKKGSGILVLVSTNAYNGPTVLESGRIQARVDHAIPDGTTLRFSGGTGTRFIANTNDSESPRRDTVQAIGRIEGSGELDDMTASSVTGAIAPAADGIITFMTPCNLSGDYEVTVGATTNSLLVLKEANQDISGLRVKVMNPAALNSDADRDTYKILDAPKGYDGHFRLADDFLGNKWNVRYESGAAYLSPVRAFVIMVK